MSSSSQKLGLIAITFPKCSGKRFAVKKAAKQIIEKHYPYLTNDFQTNKKMCDEIASIPTKRMRNKIAGFLTHLMRRIEKGPVRGISYKLYQEEREKKDQYVPTVSEVRLDEIRIDADTHAMLRAMDFQDLPGVVVAVEQTPQASSAAPYAFGGFRSGRPAAASAPR